MLLTLVALYLLVTVIIGLMAARRVRNSTDYAVAGRNLPLIMIVTTTFATWFGSETVMGIPATFIEDGLGGIVEDPFGAGLCLVLVGAFFAAKLYRMSLLTISDYYRERYGKGIEVVCSIFILLSYLGWVSAQVTALGLVFSLVTGGAVSVPVGMAIGLSIIVIYTLFGGMWSVAVTDFMQMIILVAGLLALAWYASDLIGGVQPALDFVKAQELDNFWPEPSFKEVVFFVSAALTMMLGSIPQQDVFQRVMSARDERAATWGPIIGGVLYILFAFIPIFLVISAMLIMPDQAKALLADDSQKILPTLIMNHMPFAMQVIFFGALLSAIMSTASATLLAPSVTFNENIWRHLRPFSHAGDQLRTMRITVLIFGIAVLIYAIAMQGSSIYEMVSGAYQITLVGAFTPLVFGLFWKRATTQGAWLAIALGLAVWLGIMGLGLDEDFPAPLCGLLASMVGMILGSLLPQWLAPQTGEHYELESSSPRA